MMIRHAASRLFIHCLSSSFLAFTWFSNGIKPDIIPLFLLNFRVQMYVLRLPLLKFLKLTNFRPIQAANPTYTGGKIIEDPSIESHLKNEDMLPAMNLPGRHYITSFDPSTGLHLGAFIADSEADIGRKIDRAEIAQKSWKKTTIKQRRRVVRSLLKWLVDNQDACARVACRDTGKTRKYFPVDLRPIFDRAFTFSN
jgi:hypothetical protein